MSKDIFNTIDLNLLRIFLVVFQEKNTRKAAERLFVTQPAVSQNLKKLRHFFNDELFIKVPEGLQPTPKAEQIAAKITPSLNDLQSSLNELEEFDPFTQKKKVRIAFAPQVMISLSGTFILELKARAPKLEVEIVNWSTTTFSEIENGQLLLGVSYSYSRIPKHIRELELIKLTGCCAVRQEHPLNTASAKPEAFSDFELASLFIPGWSEDLPIAAKELNAMSLPYKVGFRSAYPMAIVDVIHKTDMFFATSDLFPFDAYPYLRRLDIDSEDIELIYPLNSYFHQRNSNDPLTQWLNQLLIEELEIVRHKPKTA
ncbi:putative HTH-type transcriptional regulator YbdO [Grimontia celer]|uniref:Putative HTH-type transcriptional regulator YbdO n=1 Tax=Grimontia celer TaxID=1796497 RepID=A0A128EZF2_9GAMM|nr:LysR family transcriptional regulator [Grimontia celer]CZF79645.1 putative HTH-type transcriptional regulator YbdO [Grimontia celer]